MTTREIKAYLDALQTALSQDGPSHVVQPLEDVVRTLEFAVKRTEEMEELNSRAKDYVDQQNRDIRNLKGVQDDDRKEIKTLKEAFIKEKVAADNFRKSLSDSIKRVAELTKQLAKAKQDAKDAKAALKEAREDRAILWNGLVTKRDQLALCEVQLNVLRVQVEMAIRDGLFVRNPDTGSWERPSQPASATIEDRPAVSGDYILDIPTGCRITIERRDGA